MSILITAGTLIIFILYLIWYWNNRKYSHLKCPPHLPIIGHLMHTGTLKDFQPNTMYNYGVGAKCAEGGLSVMTKKAWDFSKIYGRIYYVLIGPLKCFIVVEDADDIEVILSKAHQKGMIYTFFEPWLGQGLLTNRGQDWHQKRKWITPAFHFKILEIYFDIFSKKAKSFCDELEKYIGEEKVDIQEKSKLCTLQVMIESAMRLNIQVDENKYRPYLDAIRGGNPDEEICYLVLSSRNLNRIILRACRPYNFVEFIYKLTPDGRQFFKDTETIKAYTFQIIKERKNDRKTSLYNKTVVEEDIYFQKKTAFLDLLLDIQEENETFTDENIREEVDTFLFEGHDTTAAALSFTLYLIAKYQDVQRKIVDELDDIFGYSTRDVTFTDLFKMNYLERVIKESLRLYPSVHCIVRQSDEDIYLNDNIKIPKDTDIILNFERLGRNPKYWPDPEKFDPDRFLPEFTKVRHPYAFVAFSAGSRNCIGQKFAMFELKTVISTILRKLHLRDVNHELDILTEVIIKSHNGVFIGIDRRN